MSEETAHSAKQYSGHNELTLDDFVEFFKDVNSKESKPGPEPFPWQRRLMKKVLEGQWPEVIDIPTGAGKTSVIDIAIFAMAARPEISPRRIVFVIDRRVVVNQVQKQAMQIQNKIKKGTTKILQTVRKRLEKMSDSGEPLGVTALQGGIPIDGEWAHRPDQPWIIVSTVDQYGSRLLFRGYGVSRSMRPIHAGLAGNDCLVILDEVHLSVPFAQTLERVASMNCGDINRRFLIVEMSATPNNKNSKPFTLDSEDTERCAELRHRIKVEKKAKIVQVQNQDAIPKKVKEIIELIKSSPDKKNIKSVGVVMNFVRTARETYRTLSDAGYATHLITGRMRPLDRVEKMKDIATIVDPDSDSNSSELTVIVATQTIEVGADISFDAIITECAAVDSLRQRFGRLDRRGNYHAKTGNPAKAWIVCPKSVVGSNKPDPIYGNSTRETWKELMRCSNNGKSQINVGPLDLKGFPDDAAAPRSEAPLLLQTHMDAWVQTNPEPRIQPTVEQFLHGKETRYAPDVSIVWRHDMSGQALKLVPPRQAEYLQIPIYAAKAWLTTREEVDMADVDHSSNPDDNILSNIEHDKTVKFVRWRGIKDGIKEIQVDDIKVGDVLVVEPGHGCLTDGNWDPSSTNNMTDLGDEAQLAHGRRVTLRLDPALIEESFQKVPIPDDEMESISLTRKRISQWLKELTHASKHQWMSKVIEQLGDDFEINQISKDKDSDNYYILCEQHHAKPIVDITTMDGSDETCSMTRTGVTLKKHLESVGDCAEKIANRLGLNGFANDLRLAGQLHDMGKADPRFQDMLVGNDPVYKAVYKEPLAKSLPKVRHIRGSYPIGMRHEIASVAMLESNKDVIALSDDKDLVLHLVGSHHGWGHPLLPVIEDLDSQSFSYQFDGHSIKSVEGISDSALALDMTDRFWRLVERYGYYGLAWLEAILRLADHQISAMEARS